MYCKNCGKQIDDKAVICPHCGVATDEYALNAQPAVQTTKTNGFAIAGFVLSLIGISLGYYTFDLVPLLGLIFSIIGLVKSKTYGSGKGLSIAGLVISIVMFVIWLILIILIIGLSMFGAFIGAGTTY